MQKFETLYIIVLCTLQKKIKKLLYYLFSHKNNKLFKIISYFEIFSRRNLCSILDSEMINRLISSSIKCNGTCFKTVEKLLQYLLLFEGNREFKIGSDFPDTL
jgi:hypothetical protein